jgi:hypothetical protein
MSRKKINLVEIPVIPVVDAKPEDNPVAIKKLKMFYKMMETLKLPDQFYVKRKCRIRYNKSVNYVEYKGRVMTMKQFNKLRGKYRYLPPAKA